MDRACRVRQARVDQTKRDTRGRVKKMECVQVNPDRARDVQSLKNSNGSRQACQSPLTKLQVSSTFPDPPRLPPNRFAAVPNLIAVPRCRRASRDRRDRVPRIHLHSRPRNSSGSNWFMASCPVTDDPTRSRNEVELAMGRGKVGPAEAEKPAVWGGVSRRENCEKDTGVATPRPDDALVDKEPSNGRGVCESRS